MVPFWAWYFYWVCFCFAYVGVLTFVLIHYPIFVGFNNGVIFCLDFRVVFNCHRTITEGCTVFVRTTVNTFCCLFVLAFLVRVRFGAVRAPGFVCLAMFGSVSESLAVVAPDKLEQPGFYIEKSYYICTYLEGGD